MISISSKMSNIFRNHILIAVNRNQVLDKAFPWKFPKSSSYCQSIILNKLQCYIEKILISDEMNYLKLDQKHHLYDLYEVRSY